MPARFPDETRAPCVCSAGVDTRPQITISFPGSPEFLRLARLTSADAGSRAGFDYEDIDDLRIGVSELCSLIADPDGAVTLEFLVAPGTVSVRGRAEPGSVVMSDLSRTIVDAVVEAVALVAEDGVARFECTKRGSSAPS
jgi:serine/threonine-protein kinase RsbW